MISLCAFFAGVQENVQTLYPDASNTRTGEHMLELDVLCSRVLRADRFFVGHGKGISMI